TAVALVQGAVESVRLNHNRIQFKLLEEAEYEAYCDTGEPFGKAGAYAIQGRAAAFITRLEGSYSGVMGLPLRETRELLKAFIQKPCSHDK
ncbi:MAG TPA: Maf family protein, partial [Xanthomonadales bacterium]|nr:Maf family protein [Xanthomonadales bacterium]